MNEFPSPSDVAPWLDQDRTFAFLKGRIALHAILKAIGVGPGDRVVVPGFTCIVVPAAITYLGAEPVFYDIMPDGINGDPSAAVSLLDERTRAVILQHSFGYPCESEPVLSACADRGIAVIEDCAHVQGATWHGRPVGTLGDAAFCSFQWSKPVTAGLGGLALANTENLRVRLAELHATVYRDPGFLYSLQLDLLLYSHRLLFGPRLYWTAVSAYRWISGKGLVPGSSSNAELTDATQPEGYERRFGRHRTRTLVRTLDRILPSARTRVENAGRIIDGLRDLDVTIPDPTPHTQPVPLRVPLMARDKAGILAAARKERIELGDWFDHPLHPMSASCGCFGYRESMCRNAEKSADRIVNIPTHDRLGPGEIRRILGFLASHRSMLAG